MPVDAARAVCARVQRWLECQHHADVFFCDKEALDAEMKRAMVDAEKKERKVLTKAFEARRKELEARAMAVGEEALPIMGQGLMSLLEELQPALRDAEEHCMRQREVLAAVQPAARRGACCVFYDGTSDAAYSNFKPYRFAVGRLGFLKGESAATPAWRVVGGCRLGTPPPRLRHNQGGATAASTRRGERSAALRSGRRRGAAA